WQSLHLADGRVEGRLAGRPLTVCTLDHLPGFSEPVLLDVDADYFLDEGDRVWLSPFQLGQALADLDRSAVTVAYSVNGGYTPLEQRWLGPATCHALSDPGNGPARCEDLGDGREPEHLPDPVRAALDVVPCRRALNQGSLHFRRQEYDRALACFEEARADEGPVADYLAGLTLSRAGRREEACDRWESLEGLPPRQKAYVDFLRARELAAQQRVTEAVAAFEAALRVEPDNPTYLHHFGLTLLEGGFLDEAAVALRKSLRLAPDRLTSLEAHMELARLYRARDQEGLARAELRQVQRKDVTGVYRLKAILLEKA
ncbi:MAG: tetratricopeptide repeat protein, partial [Candidatus Eremiobacterota bacterium]